MKNYKEAERLLNNDKYQEALIIFLDIAKYEQNNALVFQGIAQCQYYLGKYEASIESSNRALEINPKLYVPHTILSYTFGRKGNLEASRSEALKALQLDKNSFDVLNCYGTLLMAEGNLEDAKSYFLKALDKNENSILTYHNLALIYEHQSDWSRYFHEVINILRLKISARYVVMFLGAFQRKYAILTTIVVNSFIIGALYFRSKLFLLIPGIYSIKALHICYNFIRSRKWRRSISFSIATVLYLLLLFAVYSFID